MYQSPRRPPPDGSTAPPGAVEVGLGTAAWGGPGRTALWSAFWDDGGVRRELGDHSRPTTALPPTAGSVTKEHREEEEEREHKEAEHQQGGRHGRHPVTAAFARS